MAVGENADPSLLGRNKPAVTSILTVICGVHHEKLLLKTLKASWQQMIILDFYLVISNRVE